MMSFDQKQSSNISNNLHINSKGNTATPNPPSRVKEESSEKPNESQSQTKDITQRPLTNVVTPVSAHPVNRLPPNLQAPPYQSRPPPFNPSTAQCANDIPQIVTHQDGPNYHSSHPQDTLITPINTSFEPNYIIDGKYQQDFLERRLSLQIPPYQKQHQKKDSYDSVTSLSQLADIASSNIEEEDSLAKNLIGELTRTLQDFARLNQIVNDINSDFQYQLQNSQNCDPSQRLMIDVNRYISAGNFEKFVTNIPMPALHDSLQITSNIQTFFNDWLRLRKMEEVRRIQEQQDQTRNLQLQEEEMLRRKRIEESEQDTSPKKRKPSSASTMKQPLNPAESDAETTSPPPTAVSSKPELKGGVLNEDLSVRQDHKCQQCGSNDTPEWRRGPYGSRSLCNACGLFYGKLIKKFGFDEAATLMYTRRENGNGDDRRIPID